MEPVVALSLVTLSGETCLIEIQQSAKVADVRRAAIPSLGYRARSGQVTVGEQELKDTDPVADFSTSPWCIVFTSCRPKLLEAAKAAMESEEYKEAASHLHDLVQQHADLTADELKLLSSAFKARSGLLRAAWRQAREEGIATTEAAEVEAFCLEALRMLEERLLPHAPARSHERLVYGRLAGDYYRYLMELGGDEAEERRQRAHQAYEAAIAVQEDLVYPTHPSRLFLALNYAVFLHGLGDEDRAIAVARMAFEDAVGFNMGRGEEWETEGMDQGDISLALQMLRDNLTLWTQERDEAAK